ncbi:MULTISPECIES: RNA-binding S4 domain-containing protein [Novosphingobium]|uniref:RNA-binding S4 domain-containing protein n=1 Tax=Novosphingobium TaxID=165696 RepID=UPI000D6E8CB8|nr:MULTISPECIES: RNA-binding S4 domain-containing protein [Novosphingobium]
MRIDKFLWFTRFAGSRGLAQDWVGAGHIRINGRRIERCSAGVKTGDVLVLPMRSRVTVIEVLAIPARRGPALEAQACYRVLDPTSDDALDLPAQVPLARPQTDT